MHPNLLVVDYFQLARDKKQQIGGLDIHQHSQPNNDQPGIGANRSNTTHISTWCISYDCNLNFFLHTFNIKDMVKHLKYWPIFVIQTPSNFHIPKVCGNFINIKDNFFDRIKHTRMVVKDLRANQANIQQNIHYWGNKN